MNPASDNGATGRRWPEIARLAADRGLIGDTFLSDRPGHLVDLAKDAAGSGARLLVAVGGDGTVNEIVNGVAGLDGVELAVVHRGTGGDFIRTFDIPRTLEGALDLARSGHSREVDLGRATLHTWAGRDGVTWFANIASAGMSGAVAKRVNETGKALGGRLSYAWSTLAVFARWRNAEMTVVVDGEERSGPMYDVMVANGRYLAGGMKICPEADPSDGLFDVRGNNHEMIESEGHNLHHRRWRPANATVDWLSCGLEPSAFVGLPCRLRIMPWIDHLGA